MATVNLVRVTGTSLGGTDADDKVPVSEVHDELALATSVFSNGGKLALKPMMGYKRKYVSNSFIRRKSVTFGCPEHKGVSSRRVSGRRKKQLGRVVQTETEE